MKGRGALRAGRPEQGEKGEVKRPHSEGDENRFMKPEGPRPDAVQEKS